MQRAIGGASTGVHGSEREPDRPGAVDAVVRRVDRSDPRLQLFRRAARGRWACGRDVRSGEMNLSGAVRGKVKKTTISDPNAHKPLDLVNRNFALAPPGASKKA